MFEEYGRGGHLRRDVDKTENSSNGTTDEFCFENVLHWLEGSPVCRAAGGPESLFLFHILRCDQGFHDEKGERTFKIFPKELKMIGQKN